MANRNEIKDLTVKSAFTGIDLCLLNTEALLMESKLLADNKMLARAYTLAHLAFEEIAKAAELLEIAIRINMQLPVNYTTVNKLFRNHEPKIISTLLYLIHRIGFFLDNGEDYKQIIKQLFFRLEHTNISNDLKNYSLYVWYENSHFYAPMMPNLITEDLYYDLYNLSEFAFQTHTGFIRTWREQFEERCEILRFFLRKTN